MDGTLKIAVFERDRDRAVMIIDGLSEVGDFDVKVFGDDTGFAKKIIEFQPDVVLADIASESRDRLEELTLASQPDQRAVAIFVDDDDQQLMKTAIEAGVSAYVVDAISKDKIRTILNVAIARFNTFSRMRKELETTKKALAERKTIDRAKGLLMTAKGLSEDEAYALLRRTAMDQGRKVIDVAAALVTAADLLK